VKGHSSVLFHLLGLCSDQCCNFQEEGAGEVGGDIVIGDAPPAEEPAQPTAEPQCTITADANGTVLYRVDFGLSATDDMTDIVTWGVTASEDCSTGSIIGEFSPHEISPEYEDDLNFPSGGNYKICADVALEGVADRYQCESSPVPLSRYPSCSDSDGGKNEFQLGELISTTSDRPGSTQRKRFIDSFCQPGTISATINTEYYCTLNGNPVAECHGAGCSYATAPEVIDCPNGCSDGACRATT